MSVKIGIPVPTSNDPEYNLRSWPQYAAAVQQAGGEPVQIGLGKTPAEMRRAASECSGFILPGSPADVEPSAYGQDREPATAPADPAREACDRLLLEHAADSGKPVLAICFGLQFLNVWRGGTLVQDLHPVPVNHSAGSRVAVAHSALISKDSLLAGLLSAAEAPMRGDFRSLSVNSSHHQAVASPGDDLAIVARSSEDAVIEALEGRIGSSPMLGVQWHPERSCEISAASRALFTWLVCAAQDFADDAAPDLSDARTL